CAVVRPYGLSEPFSGGAEFTRNDLYVTLLSGNFEKSGKKNDFTVEVEVTLRDAAGHVVSFAAQQLLRITLPWRPEAAFEPTATRYSQSESLGGDSVNELMEAQSPGAVCTPAGLVPGVHLRFLRIFKTDTGIKRVPVVISQFCYAVYHYLMAPGEVTLRKCKF
ncbi:unnamed protein product, partial [Dibothriocephalus latus]